MFIYHLVPKPFIGTQLIPLNNMDQDSEVYLKNAKKYEGREELMEEVIPKLDCKWNDVVQFSGIDPQILLDELKTYDKKLNTSNLTRTEYLKIPIDEISKRHPLVIYHRTQKREKKDFKLKDDEIFSYEKNSYTELKEVPELTRAYWQSVLDNGGKFLWFPYVPHILVRGTIETKEYERFELKL